MSMISEQINLLRNAVIRLQTLDLPNTAKEVKEAADTIEELSEKLASANMERSTAYYNDGWISVSSGKLPDIPEGEYNSEDVNTVLKWYDGDITYSVGWYNKQGTWNEDCNNCHVIAWKPIAPYQPKGENNA